MLGGITLLDFQELQNHLWLMKSLDLGSLSVAYRENFNQQVLCTLSFDPDKYGQRLTTWCISVLLWLFLFCCRICLWGEQCCSRLNHVGQTSHAVKKKKKSSVKYTLIVPISIPGLVDLLPFYRGGCIFCWNFFQLWPQDQISVTCTVFQSQRLFNYNKAQIIVHVHNKFDLYL